MIHLRCVMAAGLCTWMTISTAQAAQEVDYLAAVRAYADAMIANGRDTYGEEHSPLFAANLDRSTMRLLEGSALRRVSRLGREEWGIRPNDRMLGGANPQHDQNLYQILYALSVITDEPRYAEKADAALAYFFQHCQDEVTGLLNWGEHAGWDLQADGPMQTRQGHIHEFFRPWVLWDRSWELAPEACERFAHGLWEHQIGDKTTGAFSRHAHINRSRPSSNAPFPRHGGFYIETWATAYQRTGDERFLHYIETVLDGLERNRLHDGGMMVSTSDRPSARQPSSVQLAIALDHAAPKLPDALATKLRRVAAINDEVFARRMQQRTAQDSEEQSSEDVNPWISGYGRGQSTIGPNNMRVVRYRQSGQEAYRQVILEHARKYRDLDIQTTHPVWPGTVGDAIILMLNAHELTGETEYLDAAHRFAQRGIELFLHDGPLPRASHMYDHYESITRADTFMMALLELWQSQHGPDAGLQLAYTDL